MLFTESRFLSGEVSPSPIAEEIFSSVVDFYVSRFNRGPTPHTRAYVIKLLERHFHRFHIEKIASNYYGILFDKRCHKKLNAQLGHNQNGHFNNHFRDEMDFRLGGKGIEVFCRNQEPGVACDDTEINLEAEHDYASLYPKLELVRVTDKTNGPTECACFLGFVRHTN